MLFEYDPFGRRIYKSSSSATSIYAYDGVNLVEETNSTGGAAVARYSQGLNIDEPLVMLRSGTTSYRSAGKYLHLRLVRQSRRLFGQPGNSFRFTGREFDTETSLCYYRARYYDPNSGRFVSEDPIRIQGGINLYAYVRNDPVRLTDPDGRCPRDQCKVQVLKPNQVPNGFNSCADEGMTLIWALDCKGDRDCCIDKNRTYQSACETPAKQFHYIADVTNMYVLGLCCKKRQ
jgi:RHS repeat-associated protein